MNRISIYVLLILIFLGISKSLSPFEKKTRYIINEKVFPFFFQGSPVSLILIDSFRMGFVIKTYFQTYKVVHGFKVPEKITVRTSKDFWIKNKEKNMGMSLFRRAGGKNTESVTPLPPGTLYVGDLAYGSWKFDNSGKKIWHFHRAYRHFPRVFGWGSFLPDYSFFEKIHYHLQNDSPFYGLDNEFGSHGTITRKYLDKKTRNKKNKKNFREYFKTLIRFPWDLDE